jgi:hypothetical protein
MGAIRSTRRPKARKLITWAMTESVSITNKPPMIGSSRSRLSSRHTPASPDPMASDPVSPM